MVQTNSPSPSSDPDLPAGPPGSEITLYLVRHATPDWTRSDLPYHLPPGPSLDRQGEAEARLLRAYLRHVGVRQIASSPLERCLQTAHLVADPQVNGHFEPAIPMETWQVLMELQPGETTGSIRGRFWPAFQGAWDLAGRAGPLALVTHGGPIAFLLAELGADAKRLGQAYEFDHRNPVPPAGAWRITRAGSGRPWEMVLAFVPADPSWQPKSVEIGTITPDLRRKDHET